MIPGQKVVRHIDVMEAAMWRVVRHVYDHGMPVHPVRIGEVIATGVDDRIIVHEQIRPGVFAPAVTI